MRAETQKVQVPLLVGLGEKAHVLRLEDKVAQSGGDFTAGSFQIQGSVNGEDWFNIGAAVTGPNQTRDITQAVKYVRVQTTVNLTGGTPLATLVVAGRSWD